MAVVSIRDLRNHGGEVIEDLESFFATRRTTTSSAPWADAQLFKTRIRRNIRLAECPSFGQSIFQYAPSSRGAEDYASLAGEIQGRPPAPLWLAEEARPAANGDRREAPAVAPAPASRP